MEASNGSAAAVAAMIGTGTLETKRKQHDEVEPFKDVKRVSGSLSLSLLNGYDRRFLLMSLGCDIEESWARPLDGQKCVGRLAWLVGV